MLKEDIVIDGKGYTVSSEGWDSETLKEAAAQLEQGILFYKQFKDELSAHVLAGLAFAYDSVANSKKESLPAENVEGSVKTHAENDEKLHEVLRKISKHINFDINNTPEDLA